MRCFIYNNRCDGEGGGIHTGGSGDFSFIFACVIANNTSRDGGGIYAGEQTLIESCTIINNKATRFGGGICIGKYGWDQASAMTGSILWNNTANGVAQQYGIYANKPFNMTRSAIQGGGLLPETDAENGIIDVSPKNMDPSKPCVALANVAPFSGAATTPEQLKQIAAESFGLTAQSACIDNGGDFSDMKITLLGGFVRTLNADRDKDVEFRPRTDGKYDIGAYEY
jgi:predicted outer membrane repeat protein